MGWVRMGNMAFSPGCVRNFFLSLEFSLVGGGAGYLGFLVGGAAPYDRGGCAAYNKLKIGLLI